MKGRRKRKVFALAFVVIILTAGCIGPFSESKPSENAGSSDQPENNQYSSETSETSSSPSLSDISGPDETSYSSGQDSNDGSGSLKLHFVDVGQSDATLIEGPEANILIDTGDWRGDEAVSYLESQNIEEIDLMILTHLDADHIGQADQIINQFEVKEVWMSGQTRTTNTFQELVNAVIESDTGYYEPRRGDVFNIGGTRVEVLHPSTTPSDTNTGIVTRLVLGDTEVLFTGDADSGVEGDILESGQQIESDIYQVGHHGSSTSSTREFVEAVNPDVAVYSAGEGNQYGHPDDEVINRLNDIGIEVYGTPVHGTVVIEAGSNGDLSVNTEKDVSPVTTPPTLSPGRYVSSRVNEVVIP
jgi:beta-lactamase superfamily II metal-dependent hydrolase